MKFSKIAEKLLCFVIITCLFSFGTAFAQAEFVISGYIRTGDSTALAKVTLNGAPGNPMSDKNGFYSFKVNAGWSGTVTPQLPYYNFTPPSLRYDNVTENQTDQDYAGKLFTYTFSGYVLDDDGTGLEGVVLSGFPDSPVTTDSEGFYSTEVEYCWSGTITPHLEDYTLTPESATFTCIKRNVSYNYIGTPVPSIDCGSTTIQSAQSGNWNDPNTWIPARIPASNDIVRVNSDDEIVVNSSAEIKVKGLCNYGTLISSSDSDLKLSASDFIYNEGVIKGGDGKGSKSAEPGSPGSSIILTAEKTFYNAWNGTIQGGRGGSHDNSSYARGGDGGAVEIYGDTITNEGKVRGGDGGGSSTHREVCLDSRGGDGGDVILLADSVLMNMESGEIITGKGGEGRGGKISCPFQGAEGGNIVFSAPTAIQNGKVVVGSDGGSFNFDPTLAMTGPEAEWRAEEVKIFAGKNWKLDFRNLGEEAIVGTQRIAMAVGEGGMIDLRGVAKAALRAPKIEIYADEILLDDDAELSDIADTPNLIVGPGRILYDFFMRIPKIVRGTAGTIVPVSLFMFNNSPEEDIYHVKVTDSRGRELNILHYTNDLIIPSLKKRESFLKVLLPADAGDSELISVTLTSQGDPSVSKTRKVQIVSSQAPYNEPKDSDNDGLPDAAENDYTDPKKADTDKDGMKDGWEVYHGLNPLLADDAGEDADEDGFTNLEEYKAASNPNNPNSTPDSVFEKGVFTAGDSGVIKIDWLYDGGGYEGEFAVFSLSGMESLTGETFTKEAVRRALSNSREGYIVFSDKKEGARFRGLLGEPTEWNKGPYMGLRRFEMIPRDRFATMLVPHFTFEELYENLTAEESSTQATEITIEEISKKRPLFSIVSPNSDYGMHLGQMADINGLGNAFVYEDIDLNAPNSDRDYNDLIVRITGATVELPKLDSLVSKSAGKKRDSANWFDWRTETELGRQIMEHIEIAPIGTGDSQVSLSFDTSADLAIYDPQGRECSKSGCYIPGAGFCFQAGDDEHQHISLSAPENGIYRVVLHWTEEEIGLLTVKKNDEILTETSAEMKAHQALISDVSVGGMGINVADPAESPAGPYDFNGDDVIDDADIELVSKIWNTCNGDENYDAFLDLDDDGCITVKDIMKVAGGN